MISYLNDFTLGNLPINWVKKKIHTRLDSIDPRSGEVVLGQSLSIVLIVWRNAFNI